jgi:hypothetical protein
MGFNQLHRAVQVSKLQHKLFPEVGLSDHVPLCRPDRALFQSPRQTTLEDGRDIEAPVEVLQKVEACVAATRDRSSRFDRLKMLPGNRPMYIFRVEGPRCCPYGHHHDGSNNFNVQVEGRDLLYHCNGSVCQNVRPLLKIGELSFTQAMMGGERGAVREGDTTVLDNLTKWFVDYWAFQGDAGGCKIVAQMYARCRRYVLPVLCWSPVVGSTG